MTASAPPTLLEALRRQTQVHHKRLDQSAFMKSWAEGGLAVESYAGYIRGTAVIRSILESHLDRARQEGHAPFWTEPLRRMPFLEQDLDYLQRRGLLDSPDAAESAQRVAETIRRRYQRAPDSLVGSLYVLEGSMQGARILRRWAEKTLEEDGPEGSFYLASSQALSPSVWDDFKNEINRLPLSGSAHSEAIQAAIEMFEGIEALLAALHPLRRETLRPLATSLNPEAGRHAVPSDSRELAAAAEAGRRCWDEFPYLERRYGARGRRFTASDSAWLVTLGALDSDTAVDQVLWLGRVLAGRGLPRLILERQLDLLVTALGRDVPEKAESWKILKRGAERLRERRLGRMAEERFESLAKGFEQAVAGEPASIPNAGRLVVSAARDARGGLPESLSTLEEWLCDPSRFSAGWIQAVRQTVANTRQAE